MRCALQLLPPCHRHAAQLGPGAQRAWWTGRPSCHCALAAAGGWTGALGWQQTCTHAGSRPIVSMHQFNKINASLETNHKPQLPPPQAPAHSTCVPPPPLAAGSPGLAPAGPDQMHEVNWLTLEQITAHLIRNCCGHQLTLPDTAGSLGRGVYEVQLRSQGKAGQGPGCWRHSSPEQCPSTAAQRRQGSQLHHALHRCHARGCARAAACAVLAQRLAAGRPAHPHHHKRLLPTPLAPPSPALSPAPCALAIPAAAAAGQPLQLARAQPLQRPPPPPRRRRVPSALRMHHPCCCSDSGPSTGLAPSTRQPCGKSAVAGALRSLR